MVCAWLGMYVGGGGGGGVCVLARSRHQASFSFSHYFFLFINRVSQNLKVTILARLAGQQAPRIWPSEVTGVFSFYMGVGDLNSACMATILPTEPSLQLSD